jgi:hypothetical protein
MLLSGELLGFAGRAVGLDSARVTRGSASDFDLIATDSDPTTRLTVSKQIGRNADVILSQNLREGGDLTWIVRYRPTRSTVVQLTTDDANSRSYEFRQERLFGRAGTAPSLAAPRPLPPRVSRVDVVAPAGEDVAALRRDVGLEVGDRFDFFAWQDGRDRLALRYHDRGHLEARIRARREPGLPDDEGQPKLALVYEIDPGPRTTLSIEGASLGGSVVASMREALRRATSRPVRSDSGWPPGASRIRGRRTLNRSPTRSHR